MNHRLQAAADDLAEKIVGAVGTITGKVVDMAINSVLGDERPPASSYDAGDAIDGDAEEAVQDTVDCLRRFIRYSKDGTAASKQERNVARCSIKRVKDHFPIASGADDIFSDNNL